MLGRQSVVVKPLQEELEDMGLDAEKVTRDILRNSSGMPMATVNPQSLVEEAGTTVQPTDDVDDFEDFEVEESEELDDEFPEIDEDFEDDDDDEMSEDDDDVDAEDLEEAFKVQKMRRLTSGEKAKAKKARKKSKGKRKAYAKKYYARQKKKIAKRRKKLLKKYGKKGLEKLHKQRKRLVAGIDRLSTLREELEDAGAPGTTVTPVEEAAINAGWLALLLGEIFESLGDADVAEMLEAISDTAAGLSEELEGATEDDLTEDQEKALRQIFESVAKALEAHEDLGSPSLMEAIDYGLENGLMEDEDEEDGELDEDEELEDDSPFDELDEAFSEDALVAAEEKLMSLIGKCDSKSISRKEAAKALQQARKLLVRSGLVHERGMVHQFNMRARKFGVKPLAESQELDEEEESPFDELSESDDDFKFSRKTVVAQKIAAKLTAMEDRGAGRKVREGGWSPKNIQIAKKIIDEMSPMGHWSKGKKWLSIMQRAHELGWRGHPAY